MSHNNSPVNFNTRKIMLPNIGGWVWPMRNFQSRMSKGQLEATKQLVIPKPFCLSESINRYFFILKNQWMRALGI